MFAAASAGAGAVAAGTQRPAAAARVAARTRHGLDTDRRPSQHAPEPVFELDLRLPAEQLAGAGDVGLADLRVVDGQRLVDDLAARAGHLEDGLGQLQDRDLPRVADVHREVLAALREQDEPADEVVDVAEAPGL